MSNNDTADLWEAADGATLSRQFAREAFDGLPVRVINDVGADSTGVRSVYDALRTRQSEVLEEWRDGLGVFSSADLSGLVRIAHLIRDALRPDQVGGGQGLA